MKTFPALFLSFGLLLSNLEFGASRPNILFIALDDLNDWVGCLGGHPQTLTPNLDRLAASATLFTNAHCPGAACNPSRTAIFTGLSPHLSGLYENGQKMREVLPDAKILPQHFRDHGYRAIGSGKMLHYFIDASSWDEYFPKKENEDPFPFTLYPKKRPLSLPVGGPWQYVETDWGPLDATDQEFGGDAKVAEWVSQQLSLKQDQPLFLACGFYRPHEPWFVPAKYFAPFPLDKIQLPPGYRENDLADLPPSGQKLGPNRYFAHIQKHGQWKKAIQGYLASIHFADAQLGRVLDALENGPNAHNTIVVLWSDHGWHLGEKQHWQKYTAWRVGTRVPLIIRVPENTSPTLPSGTIAHTTCDQPVNVLSLFPTLTQLTGIAPKKDNSAPSLLPLLKDPSATKAPWPHTSITFLGKPNSYGLSTKDWRYLHYANGDEELYHIKTDPHEWTNLAPKKEHQEKLNKLRALAPKKFAPLKKASFAALPTLPWHPAGSSDPRTTTDKTNPKITIHILNQSGQKLLLSDNLSTDKKLPLKPGEKKQIQTYAGATWFARTTQNKTLGTFTVADRRAKVIIPAP